MNMVGRFLLSALLVVIAASAGQAQVLYGATSNGAPGELFILNPANGATIQDIGPLNDSGGVNYPITGLAFNPLTRVLYGSTGNSAAAGANARMLVTINPATARVTPIGFFNVGNATMTELAFSGSGQLYGINSTNPDLHLVNLLTGQATAVGASGLPGFSQGGALAINSSGAAFGSPQANEFGSYDLTTGAYTHIGVLATPAGTNTGYAAMAFDNNGVLYGDDLGAPPHLVTINLATAAVNDLGTSVLHLDAIAFSPTPVPEPSSLLLGGVAALFASSLRRRFLGRQ
jgi:hypothetical protein